MTCSNCTNCGCSNTQPVQKIDSQYENLLHTILADGDLRVDARTGVATRSVFGPQLVYDFRNGFPLITTRTINPDVAIKELLWFLSGSTNVNDLHPVKIWDAWAAEDGSLGPIYGAQWRAWVARDGTVIDQIKTLVDTLSVSPSSRRMCVSAWNVGDLPEMALSPCHAFFQAYVKSDDRLWLKLTQRSADVPVGVPFNITEYAVLCYMLAHVTGLTPGGLIWSGGDTHVYQDQIALAHQQCARTPLLFPTLRLVDPPTTIDGWSVDNFAFDGYVSHSSIKYPVTA